MNHVACPRCGAEVDSLAPACPRCGEKIYVEHPADMERVRHKPLDLPPPTRWPGGGSRAPDRDSQSPGNDAPGDDPGNDAPGNEDARSRDESTDPEPPDTRKPK